MLSRDSEDEMWSGFVFELVIRPHKVTLARWIQPSGSLCPWQCFRFINILAIHWHVTFESQCLAKISYSGRRSDDCHFAILDQDFSWSRFKDFLFCGYFWNFLWRLLRNVLTRVSERLGSLLLFLFIHSATQLLMKGMVMMMTMIMFCKWKWWFCWFCFSITLQQLIVNWQFRCHQLLQQWHSLRCTVLVIDTRLCQRIISASNVVVLQL